MARPPTIVPVQNTVRSLSRAKQLYPANTKRLGFAFRTSASDSGITRKKSQLLRQLKIFEHSMVLVSTGEQARLMWHPFGTQSLNNCGISMNSSATASCHTSIVPTPRSGIGFRISAATTSCSRKESQVKSSPMTVERIRELESIGFDWRASQTSWNERLKQLRDYKAEFGHCLVPFKYSANPALGR